MLKNADIADNGTLKAAYDYHATVVATRTKQQVTKCCPPFGEQLTLVEPTDKVTENFTGKERDDETALNYFGARYLDPMLGMWASVDPARQFASSYLYAGNGMNPMNVVDGDGKFVISQFENTFRYHYHSSLSILFLEGTKYIPVLGPLISAFLPTGEVVNSHRSKWYEGLTSAVADFVGFGLSKNLASFLGKNPPLLSSFIDDAFYITQEMNIINNFISLYEMSPSFESYMSDLTLMAGVSISGSSINDVMTKASWANSYAQEMFNNNVEITPEIGDSFRHAYLDEFRNENE